MKLRTLLYLLLTTMIASTLLTDCSTVPITERKRVNLVSDEEILPASFAQYEGFLKENKLSSGE